MNFKAPSRRALWMFLVENRKIVGKKQRNKKSKKNHSMISHQEEYFVLFSLTLAGTSVTI
jgi:hypothetical protein